MAWLRMGNKPLPEVMLTYCHLDHREQTSLKFGTNHSNSHLQNVSHFVEAMPVGSHCHRLCCVIQEKNTTVCSTLPFESICLSKHLDGKTLYQAQTIFCHISSVICDKAYRWVCARKTHCCCVFLALTHRYDRLMGIVTACLLWVSFIRALDSPEILRSPGVWKMLSQVWKNLRII